MQYTISATLEKLILVILALLLIGSPARVTASTLPANLLTPPKASPHYAILVEKASQQLFVYQFDGDYHLAATFSCATGENPGDKQISGDRKTPEGIYFFTKAVGEKYLSPIYGARAFPMNYPNLMDQRRQKEGNGIWVHGTNEELKQRSSNGCIVLANGDVAQLDAYIRLWNTPIIIEENLIYEERENLRREGSLLFDSIKDWSRAWSEKDLDRYLSYYAGDFRWKTLDLQGWRKRKAWLNQRYNKISVQLEDIRLFRQGGVVLATAEETYRSDQFASSGYKHLYLVQNSKEWRILGEDWRKSGRPAPPLLQVATKPPTDEKESEELVRRFVEKWRLAWQEGDLSSYMACYHPGFTDRGMDLKGWRRYKKWLFQRSPERIIQLTDITAELNGFDAVVVSKQEYRSGIHQDLGLKTLHLRWHRDHWTIFRESWQPLAGQE